MGLSWTRSATHRSNRQISLPHPLPKGMLYRERLWRKVGRISGLAFRFELRRLSSGTLSDAERTTPAP